MGSELQDLLYLKNKKKELFLGFYRLLQKHEECLKTGNTENVELILEDEKKCIMAIDDIDTQYSQREKDSFGEVKKEKIVGSVHEQNLQKVQKEIEEVALEAQKLNNSILNLMEIEMKKTQQDIRELQDTKIKLKQQETINHRYNNPYEQAAQASYFIDKKN